MSTNHNLFVDKGEPKRYRTEVPLTSPLGLTAKPNRLTMRMIVTIRLYNIYILLYSVTKLRFPVEEVRLKVAA